ncbi:hypothetical protein Bbelb_186550 [Branchiostoma belcheri]|nr:hypothetical protein Bbelb_186550 [Branchiostoma belcheri]
MVDIKRPDAVRRSPSEDTIQKYFKKAGFLIKPTWVMASTAVRRYSSGFLQSLRGTAIPMDSLTKKALLTNGLLRRGSPRGNKAGRNFQRSIPTIGAMVLAAATPLQRDQTETAMATTEGKREEQGQGETEDTAVTADVQREMTESEHLTEVLNIGEVDTSLFAIGSLIKTTETAPESPSTSFQTPPFQSTPTLSLDIFKITNTIASSTSKVTITIAPAIFKNGAATPITHTPTRPRTAPKRRVPTTDRRRYMLSNEELEHSYLDAGRTNTPLFVLHCGPGRCSEGEFLRCNVNGSMGRQKLDEVRMDKIKDYTANYFNLNTSHKLKMAWKACCESINTWARTVRTQHGRIR